MGIKKYKKLINNDVTYVQGFVYSNQKYSISSTDGLITLGGLSFTEDINKVVISAKGYSDLTVYVSKDGELVKDNSGNGEDESVADLMNCH